GALNDSEPGLAGVTLTLTGTSNLGLAVSASTTTARRGTYSFGTGSSVLPPGTYQIAEGSPPSGYLQGGNTVGTVGGAAVGSLLAGNKIGSIALYSGQGGVNYNFGWVLPVTLAGNVYEDSNINGALDSNEPRLGGVTLTLTGTTNLGLSVSAS